MTRKRLLCLIGWCLAAPGCSMYESGARTLFLEPVHYHINGDNCLNSIRNRVLANAAWKSAERSQPHGRFPRDYAKGFKAGYAEYLDAGGSGEPPPLPPRRYWKIYRETLEGHQAAEDWFAGYRHGGAAAKASGYRELIVVPTAPDHAHVAYAPEPFQDGSLPEPIPTPPTPVEAIFIPANEETDSTVREPTG